MSETLERSLVMVKPEGMRVEKEMRQRLDLLGGERILTAIINPVPIEFIRELYLPHEGRDTYEDYIDWFRGKEAVFYVYRGEKIIGKIRESIGATEPAKAKPGTIRRDYGGRNESLELARIEGRVIRNIIHGSDEENAEREMALVGRTLSYLIDSLLSTPPANLLACPTFFISSGGIRFS